MTTFTSSFGVFSKIAKKRYGLCILNYIVTSNHIHLLLKAGEKRDVIARSIQLIASRSARGYNIRKNRSGAFWEDHYHATAVQTGKYLIQCLIYIDLNMVRARVVRHPSQWPFGGYHEIFSDRQRYRIIDTKKLLEMLEIENIKTYRKIHGKRINDAICCPDLARKNHWTESVAVGSEKFAAEIKSTLGLKAYYRKIEKEEGLYTLREKGDFYKKAVFAHEMEHLRHYLTG